MWGEHQEVMPIVRRTHRAWQPQDQVPRRAREPEAEVAEETTKNSRKAPILFERNAHVLKEIGPRAPASNINEQGRRRHIILPWTERSFHEKQIPNQVTWQDLRQLPEQFNDTLERSLRALVYNLQNGSEGISNRPHAALEALAAEDDTLGWVNKNKRYKSSK